MNPEYTPGIVRKTIEQHLRQKGKIKVASGMVIAANTLFVTHSQPSTICPAILT